jgi:predicted N-acetyltransferase YhbS
MTPPMNVNVRRYEHHTDYNRVGQFLIDTYQPGDRHDNWLQPRWEYMHYHPLFNESLSTAFSNTGVWQLNGGIVGVVHFEHCPGQIFFQVHPDLGHLKPEMLEYAETYLRVDAGGEKRKIEIWVKDFDNEFESIIRERGYHLVEGVKDFWSIFEIPDSFPIIKLPNGFYLQSLADENDLNKLHRVLHRGFNHPGEPPSDELAGRVRMQSAPNYRKDLNIVAVAPDGTYASYGGIWQDHVNRIAYVEPVCTDPDYRRMGLGTAVVLEGIRRCGKEGAVIAMVGSDQPFYMSMGFKKFFDINLWAREWQV